MKEIYFVHNTTIRYKTDHANELTADTENCGVKAFFTYDGAKKYLDMLVEAQKDIEGEGFKGESEFGIKSKNNSLIFVPGWKMISDKILYGVRTRVEFMNETAETYRFITSDIISE